MFIKSRVPLSIKQLNIASLGSVYGSEPSELLKLMQCICKYIYLYTSVPVLLGKCNRRFIPLFNVTLTFVQWESYH